MRFPWNGMGEPRNPNQGQENQRTQAPKTGRGRNEVSWRRDHFCFPLFAFRISISVHLLILLFHLIISFSPLLLYLVKLLIDYIPVI